MLLLRDNDINFIKIISILRWIYLHIFIFFSTGIRIRSGQSSFNQPSKFIHCKPPDDDNYSPPTPISTITQSLDQQLSIDLLTPSPYYMNSTSPSFNGVMTSDNCPAYSLADIVSTEILLHKTAEKLAVISANSGKLRI